MKKDTQLIICPILREPNGLAMSSRNLRLNDKEKNIASGLYKTLQQIHEKLAPGNFSYLKKEAIVHLENAGFAIDYLELAKSDNLEIVEDYKSHEKYIVLIAAFLNNVRLIDNLEVTGPY